MLTSIYVNSQTSEQTLKTLESVLGFLGLDDENYFMVFDEISMPKLPSSLALIHFNNILKRHDTRILFLNIEDFNKKAKYTQATKILYVRKEEIINIDTTLIKDDTQIIVADKQKQLRYIKNAELQSILR